MKKIMTNLLPAILGSIITLGAYEFIYQENNQNLASPALPQAALYAAKNNLTAAPLSSGYPSETSFNFTAAAEKSMPAVVHIMSTQTQAQQRSQNPFREFFDDDFFGPFFYEGPREGQREPQVGSGSGVIINANGYIVTNNHVIEGAEKIEVSLNDNRTYEATVVGTDPDTDIAVVRIEDTDLPYLDFFNSDQVKVGEWVLAVGNPFNLNSTATAGIVSAKARNINILRDQSAIESFIQTDAAVNPGNSGGALVNLEGELIGINTAIASPTGSYSGYSFAVPANIVKKVVDDLIEYGTVQRAWLGVSIRDVTSQLAEEEGLNVISGVFVDTVLANSSASDLGLKQGDVIIAVDDKEVNTAPELQAAIGTHRPGDKVTLSWIRAGKEQSKTVTLKNREGSYTIVERRKTTSVASLGVELQELSGDEKQQLGIENGIQVSRLYAGKIRSETNMEEGFIITRIDGKPVNSVADVNSALEGKSGGVLLEGVYPDREGEYYYAFGM